VHRNYLKKFIFGLEIVKLAAIFAFPRRIASGESPLFYREDLQ